MASRSALAKSESVTALGVVAPPPIRVTTVGFDGSLAALFQCVRDRSIDLCDIPLLPICESYFAFLLASPEMNLEEAAAALTALAYLLERKAAHILPGSDEATAPEEPLELPDPTVHDFDLAIESLERWQQERSRHFFRTSGGGVDPYEVPYDLEQVALPDLARAFERLLARASPEPIEPLSRPRRSLADGMRSVLLALSDEPLTLDELLLPPFTRSEAVLWFLALLELIRLGQASVQVDDSIPRFCRKVVQGGFQF